MFCQKCGNELGESQTFCKFCGTRSASTTTSESKRKQYSFARRMWLFLGILVGILALHILVSNTDPNTLRNGPSAPTAEVQKAQKPSVNAVQSMEQTTLTPLAAEQTMPQDESRFIDIIAYHKMRYGDASNEFQKSTVRRQRAERIASILPGRLANDWVGQVSSMQTTSDGLGILSVKLPGNTDIKVKTMDNGLSDIGEHTLIPQGSPLYNQVASLAVGDQVAFSGRFSSRDTDYIEEVSITEKGSMTEPDFVITFPTVSKKPL
jgi:hypothetical protein